MRLVGAPQATAEDSGYRPTEQKPAAKEARSTPGGPKARRKGPVVDPRIAMVLGVVGMLGLAFAVWYGVTHLKSASADLKPVGTTFASGIPISKAERFAGSIVATLANDSWLNESAGSRTKDLEESFSKLPAGSRALVIKDRAGNVRATAQPNPRSIRPFVKFF